MALGETEAGAMRADVGVRKPPWRLGRPFEFADLAVGHDGVRLAETVS
jgi:hypothetical protein